MGRPNLSGHGIISGGYVVGRPLTARMRASDNLSGSGDCELADKVDGWVPIGEVNLDSQQSAQALLVILSNNIATYNREKVKPYHNDVVISEMEANLKDIFLKIQCELRDRYAGSLFNALYQQFMDYESSKEARMKVEAIR